MKPQENAKNYLFSYLRQHHTFDNSIIYIFGSYARNQEKYDSDLDVLLIADNLNQEDILRAVSSLRYINDNTSPIDIKFISRDKWNNSNSTFVNTIKKEGLDVTEEFRNLL